MARINVSFEDTPEVRKALAQLATHALEDNANESNTQAEEDAWNHIGDTLTLAVHPELSDGSTCVRTP